MTRIALTAIALATMTSAAFAEPAKLSDQQLDQAVAGFFNTYSNFNLTVQEAEALAYSGWSSIAVAANINKSVQVNK
jgi:hypothetical protein